MRTRPAISWSDLRGRLVGVWGLGVEGRATIRKLADLGVTSVLVDDAPPAAGVDGRQVDATADGGLEALARCDVVIKTPGISRYRPEVDVLAFGGTPVVGGLGLWLAEADRDRVVCITGTKGKSTTTAIAGHLLTGLGRRVMIGGNLGLPPYDPEAPTDVDHWVIEVSSYQAADVPVSPPVVAVTSLHPDHLTWHRDDPETYYADKLSLCSQRGADLTIANGDSPLLRDRAGLLGPRVEWITEPTGENDAAEPAGPADDWTAGLGLLGAHNHRNALIARACLVALGVDGARDEAALAAAAEGFEHLESRLRPVDTVDGVLFVDDSLSTNVLPTLAAVDAFPGRRVAVIVGGQDRGIDYGPLAAGLAARTAPTLVTITESEAAGRIRVAFDTAAVPDNVAVVDCVDLGTAVETGHRWASPDGVVLLSPAAPSFDRFRDYRARAAAFVDAVAGLRAASGRDRP
ncbi:MAG TPA: UDP-N-acetylmuramoyl-L-alanine--D-glutamate ligase [Acidimicrobiales bacterium]|nr:UDP-N-acetylmuramoyl-L-alanine--D-glutamate ligase [Acidimicrobiales bacterium]